jgi:hypothetical protein
MKLLKGLCKKLEGAKNGTFQFMDGIGSLEEKKPNIRITKFCEGIVNQHNTTYSQSRIILIHFLIKESMLRLYSCGDSTLATTTIVNGFNIASKTSGLASNAKINLLRPQHA